MCIEVLVLRTALETKEDSTSAFEKFKKKMLSNKEWLAFSHNIKNKQHLLNLFVTYLCVDDFVKSSVANTG